MSHKSFNLRKLEFTKKKRNPSFTRRILHEFQMLIRFILVPRSPLGRTPVRPKYANLNTRSGVLFFELSILKTLFPDHSKMLRKMHCVRMQQWRWWVKFCNSILIILSVTILYLGAVVAIYFVLPRSLGSSSAPFLLISFSILSLTFYLLLVVTLRFMRKISLAITLRPYADTICTFTCALIVLALEWDDILQNSEKRAQLINSLDSLAHNTASLAWRFSSRSEIERKWSSDHFRYIERYVRERERWVIAPGDSTLEELRKDFYKLAEMYFLGNYGSFDWSEVGTPPPSEPSKMRDKAFGALPRIVSIILPVVLFALLIWQKAGVENIGLGVNIVALVLFSWFLLAVDAALKLGIVAGVANLAKEIRSIK